jgi:hypothetical protein
LRSLEAVSLARAGGVSQVDAVVALGLARKGRHGEHVLISLPTREQACNWCLLLFDFL